MSAPIDYTRQAVDRMAVIDWLQKIAGLTDDLTTDQRDMAHKILDRVIKNLRRQREVDIWLAEGNDPEGRMDFGAVR